MGLQIVFPDDYIVKDVSSCTFVYANASDNWLCLTDSDTNTIEVTSFTDSTIAAETVITFEIDSVINPGTYGVTGEILVNTIDSLSIVQDSGSYTFLGGYFTYGNITTFTVIP